MIAGAYLIWNVSSNRFNFVHEHITNCSTVLKIYINIYTVFTRSWPVHRETNSAKNSHRSWQNPWLSRSEPVALGVNWTLQDN
jgi:hypothetical protein